jgi:hypothetical protein
MINDNLPAEITRLEAEIERLTGIAEGCRKLILAAKAAIAIGAVLLVATVAGLLKFDQLTVLVSIAAVLGGIVTLGSNSTTLHQTLAGIAKAETLRSQLIGQIEFPVPAGETSNVRRIR